MIAALIPLALLLSPALAAGETPPDWRLLYEDGASSPLRPAGEASGEAPCRLRSGHGSERHAPRRWNASARSWAGRPRPARGAG